MHGGGRETGPSILRGLLHLTRQAPYMGVGRAVLENFEVSIGSHMKSQPGNEWYGASNAVVSL